MMVGRGPRPEDELLPREQLSDLAELFWNRRPDVLLKEELNRFSPVA